MSLRYVFAGFLNRGSRVRVTPGASFTAFLVSRVPLLSLSRFIFLRFPDLGHRLGLEHVRVDHRGPDVPVPEHLPDAFQVCPVLYPSGASHVAQRVKRHPVEPSFLSCRPKRLVR